MRKKPNPQNPDRKRAYKLFREVSFDNARRLFSIMAQRNARDHEAWLMQGLCLQKLGQLDKARACMERAFSLNPRSAKILNAFGFDWLEKGWIDRAIKTLMQALKRKEDYSSAHDHLIKALLQPAATSRPLTHVTQPCAIHQIQLNCIVSLRSRWNKATSSMRHKQRPKRP